MTERRNSGGESLDEADRPIRPSSLHVSSPHDSTSSLPWIQSASSTPTGPPIQNKDIVPVEAATGGSYEEINPGEYVLQTLFSEFTILAEKKIDRLLKESFVSVLYFIFLFVCFLTTLFPISKIARC